MPLIGSKRTTSKLVPVNVKYTVGDCFAFTELGFDPLYPHGNPGCSSKPINTGDIWES